MLFMKCENCNSDTDVNFGDYQVDLCVDCAGEDLVEDYPTVLSRIEEQVLDGRGSTTVVFKTRLLGVDKEGYAVYMDESNKKILYVCPVNSNKHDRHNEVIKKSLRFTEAEIPGGPPKTSKKYLTTNRTQDHIQLTEQEKVDFGRLNTHKLSEWMNKQEWAALSEYGKKVI